MPVNSRAKGARWALSCRRTLERLGVHVTTRSLGEAGDDLILAHPHDWLTVECKDQQTLTIGAWVDQARRNARTGQLPVVWIKRKRQPDPLEGFIVIHAGDYWRDITGRL